jgi:hypothetical protein
VLYDLVQPEIISMFIRKYSVEEKRPQLRKECLVLWTNSGERDSVSANGSPGMIQTDQWEPREDPEDTIRL